MKLFAKDNKEVAHNRLHSIRSMLLTQGLGGTLDYFCTFSVFSIS